MKSKEEIAAFLKVFTDAKEEIAKWPEWMQAAIETTAGIPKAAVKPPDLLPPVENKGWKIDARTLYQFNIEDISELKKVIVELLLYEDLVKDNFYAKTLFQNLREISNTTLGTFTI